MADIDFVITWVDGSDPQWLARKSQYAAKDGDDSPVRYRDWGLLRSWFRGVARFAPWVRTVHLVTCNPPPAWLRRDAPGLHIVDHRDFIPAKDLPTFNSRAIEVNLHRIPGLSEQFVYFNDDMFLTAPVSPAFFFRNGLPCDSFGLDAIMFGQNSIGWANGTNIGVINDHFALRPTVKKHWRKILSPANGVKQVFRTVLLTALYPWFPGLRYEHGPVSYLKSTFEQVWAEAPEALCEASASRFRVKGTVNQFVMKYWQLASGAFVPRTNKKSFCVQMTDDNIGLLCKALESGRYPVICANDTKQVKDFPTAQQKLLRGFEALLPEPCAFELPK